MKTPKLDKIKLDKKRNGVRKLNNEMLHIKKVKEVNKTLKGQTRGQYVASRMSTVVDLLNSHICG